jgi:hypothetical protein
MSSFRKALCVIYAAIAVAALFATWSQNLPYFTGAHLAGNGPSYLLDLKANGAARSFTVDIGLFLLAATFLMAVEARRLGIKWVWLYVVFGFLVAISVTFPLFMIARELRVAKLKASGALPGGEVKLAATDIVGLSITTTLTAGLCWFILS